jgi:hypothetical protein
LTVPLAPVAALTGDLFQSTQQKGAVEGLLRFVYYAAVAQARYDDVGHILPAFPLVKDTCNLYATTTVKSCDAHFATGAVRRRASAKPTRKRTSGTAAAASPPAQAQEPAGATPSTATDAATPRPLAPSTLPKVIADVLDGVLGAITGSKPKAPAAAAPSAPGAGPTKDLLDYLLGP